MARHGSGRRNGLSGRTKKLDSELWQQDLDQKTAPGVRSAFPRIAATKSGQLMCYENRTTAKATDINRPEINRTHTNGTPSTQATCSHCVTYDACARSPATAAEALRGGRRVS